MSVAKVTEIIASSTKSFDDAVASGIKRADQTINGIASAWVKNQSVTVKNGKISEYRVNMQVTFVLGGGKKSKTSKKSRKKTAAKKKK